MSFFENNDQFESIINELFSGRPRRNQNTIIQGEEEDRNIDFLETKDKIYLIFELPGYNKKDLNVNIKNKELEIKAKKTNGENIQDYLTQKLHRGFSIQKTLPESINVKKSSHTMKNGVLEITFNKK